MNGVQHIVETYKLISVCAIYDARPSCALDASNATASLAVEKSFVRRHFLVKHLP